MPQMECIHRWIILDSDGDELGGTNDEDFKDAVEEDGEFIVVDVQRAVRSTLTYTNLGIDDPEDKDG